MPAVRGKLVLNVMDGLIAGYAGGLGFKPRFSWNYGALYFSTDPVAIDSLCVDVLDAKGREATVPLIRPLATTSPQPIASASVNPTLRKSTCPKLSPDYFDLVAGGSVFSSVAGFSSGAGLLASNACLAPSTISDAGRIIGIMPNTLRLLKIKPLDCSTGALAVRRKRMPTSLPSSENTGDPAHNPTSPGPAHKKSAASRRRPQCARSKPPARGWPPGSGGSPRSPHPKAAPCASRARSTNGSAFAGLSDGRRYAKSRSLSRSTTSAGISVPSASTIFTSVNSLSNLNCETSPPARRDHPRVRVFHGATGIRDRQRHDRQPRGIDHRPRRLGFRFRFLIVPAHRDALFERQFHRDHRLLAISPESRDPDFAASSARAGNAVNPPTTATPWTKST